MAQDVFSATSRPEIIVPVALRLKLAVLRINAGITPASAGAQTQNVPANAENAVITSFSTIPAATAAIKAATAEAISRIFVTGVATSFDCEFLMKSEGKEICEE